MAEKKQESEKTGFFHRINRYFKDVRGEAKKVVWPTGKQLLNNTLIVFAMIICFGVFIWGIDAALGFATRAMLGS